MHIRQAFFPGDLRPIRELLDVSLPIRYEDAFYESLQSDGSMLSLVALADGPRPGVVGVLTATTRVHDDDAEGLFDWLESAWTAAISFFGFQSAVDRFPQGYICTLAVADSHRGCGVGTALLSAALNALSRRGCTEASLHVLISNMAARRLYERAGFVQSELVRDYYAFGGKHHDALRYARPLQRAAVASADSATRSIESSCMPQTSTDEARRGGGAAATAAEVGVVGVVDGVASRAAEAGRYTTGESLARGSRGGSTATAAATAAHIVGTTRASDGAPFTPLSSISEATCASSPSAAVACSGYSGLRADVACVPLAALAAQDDESALSVELKGGEARDGAEASIRVASPASPQASRKPGSGAEAARDINQHADVGAAGPPVYGGYAARSAAGCGAQIGDAGVRGGPADAVPRSEQESRAGAGAGAGGNVNDHHGHHHHDSRGLIVGVEGSGSGDRQPIAFAADICDRSSFGRSRRRESGVEGVTAAAAVSPEATAAATAVAVAAEAGAATPANSDDGSPDAAATGIVTWLANSWLGKLLW